MSLLVLVRSPALYFIELRTRRVKLSTDNRGKRVALPYPPLSGDKGMLQGMKVQVCHY